MKVISHVLVICCTLAFAMFGVVSTEIFPPQESGYLGDHIVITTPGKYTLERDLNHSYPVGVVILSSSVVISGNNHTISPSSSGEESVGIWIAAYDVQGRPITSVTINDFHIEGETYGIFIEGDNLTPFSWANDSKKPAESTRQKSSTQMLEILSSTISSCGTAIGISDGNGVRITDVNLSENEYGLTASGTDLRIQNSTITRNSKVGVLLDGVTLTSLSQNIITENDIGIEARNNSIETLHEADNIYDNKQNIVTDKETSSLSDISAIPALSQNIDILHEEKDSSVELDPMKTPTPISLRDEFTVVSDTPFVPSTPSPTSTPLPNQTSSREQIIESDPLSVTSSPPPTPSSPRVEFTAVSDTPSVPSSPPPTSSPLPTQTSSPAQITAIFDTPSEAPPLVIQNPTHSPPRNVISGTHATIISDTIPDVLSPGSRNRVSITIANTGSTAWQSDEGIGVSAVGDTSRYAPAWRTIPSKATGKNREYTINFELLAPATQGEYTFLFQVERRRSEMTSTFGRPYEKKVLIS
jgi:hypothetical protein